MFTRRDFVRTLPGLPAALCCGASGAATVNDASKVCLVVGNSAYSRMALRNPVNDARAMSELFAAANFSVDFQQDVKLDAFKEAVDRFGETVQHASTRLAVFYYAGHGVQLDWRNYLLPVDAQVGTADQLKARCLDLGLLLGKFADTKDKTHIVFLDACRNDPFGGTYQPAQAGLSQVDAPVGSLLAYSTAPGKVAFDGRGANGPYVQNLVRELSRRDAQLEDALKRVRLNVRLESSGMQIPWESTSLERAVYLFDDGRKPLSDADLENAVKEDLDYWERIKSSRNPQDWIAYLRTFPNGRFAEIAQDRLTRLLATQASPPVAGRTSVASAPAAAQTGVPVAIVASAPVASQPPAQARVEPPAIVVAPGAPPPQLARPSGNPYSAGVYPLGRVFSVGDEATFRVIDIIGGREKTRYSIRITKVDLDADRIEANGGKWVYDAMGNPRATPRGASTVPKQLVPAEFQIGKKWQAAFADVNGQWATELDLKVVAREIVRAGDVDFLAFRVEGRGIRTRLHRNFVRLEWRFWYVPGLNFSVVSEYIERAANAVFLFSSNRDELIMLRQQRTGLSTTA